MMFFDDPNSFRKILFLQAKALDAFACMVWIYFAYTLILARLILVLEWAVSIADFPLDWYCPYAGLCMQRFDITAAVVFIIFFTIRWFYKAYRQNCRLRMQARLKLEQYLKP